jgi:hypothetical protein
VLAACVVHPGLLPALAELSGDHFDSDLHRRLRTHLVDQTEATPDVVELIAELDAHADAEEIGESAGEQRILQLRDSALQRELQAEQDPARRLELQGSLARVREAVRNFASA